MVKSINDRIDLATMTSLTTSSGSGHFLLNMIYVSTMYSSSRMCSSMGMNVRPSSASTANLKSYSEKIGGVQVSVGSRS